MSASKVPNIQELQSKYRSYEKKQHFKISPTELYAPVRYIMNQRGKRIRPLALLLINKVFGGDIKEALPAAYGVELFHNFTLMHDDIMDASPIRRGKETVYKKFGTNNAILSGDVMSFWACQYINESETLAGKKNLSKAFFGTAIRICEGQSMDMSFEKKWNVQEREYYKMIQLKTAVLLGLSLQMGYMLTNKSKASLGKELYKLGVRIGICFQVVDDWLDFFGKEKKVGKVNGGDVLNGKKSVLFFLTKKKCNSKDKKILEKAYHKNTNPKKRLAVCKKLFTKYKIKEAAFAVYEEQHFLIHEQIDKLKIETHIKLALKAFAYMLLKREN